MKEFANLISDIETSTATKGKLAALERYFAAAPPTDAAWAAALLIGKRPKRAIKTNILKQCCSETTKTAPWLFDECYQAVGDLAETITHLLSSSSLQEVPLPFVTLTEWINFLATLRTLNEEEQRAQLKRAWSTLKSDELFAFHKLITGGFRLGVAKNLIFAALAKRYGTSAGAVAHLLAGNWDPAQTSFDQLFSSADRIRSLETPYPFFLAYPIEQEIETLGEIDKWQAEWKWDGIRAQLIKREEEVFIWSRGEELISESFPELVRAAHVFPSGTVLDGEIVGVRDGVVQTFSALQPRLGRTKVSEKRIRELAVQFIVYDLLEYEGVDLRGHPLASRRSLLSSFFQCKRDPLITLSEPLVFKDWTELTQRKISAREYNAEGLMLKSLDSPYGVGRKRGGWWKWKLDPFSVDGVLIYAQQGHGRRATLYTDYTFGVWHEGKLTPFAKAYSGLTDEEIKEVDSHIRKNTIEKFGPVRTVKPTLVFEIGFEGIQRSKRHKSGIAVRFPRILRWRKDKPVEEADTLESLQKLLR